jgi:2-aminoadipate transaminase
VAVEPQLRRWDALFAARTRGGAGEGLVEILALAGRDDVISFAGGLPDPATFPAAVVAEIMGELAEAGDASPFQYAPTDGLAGPRDYVAGRLERFEGRRPGEGELTLTSGAIEALELVGKALVDKGDRVLVEAPRESPSTRRASPSTSSPGCSSRRLLRSSSTRSPTFRTRRA